MALSSIGQVYSCSDFLSAMQERTPTPTPRRHPPRLPDGPTPVTQAWLLTRHSTGVPSGRRPCGSRARDVRPQLESRLPIDGIAREGRACSEEGQRSFPTKIASGFHAVRKKAPLPPNCFFATLRPSCDSFDMWSNAPIKGANAARAPPSSTAIRMAFLLSPAQEPSREGCRSLAN